MFGHPPGLSGVIVFLQGPPSVRKGMMATVQKIGGGVLQDERLVSGKGGPGRVAGSSGSDLS